MITDSREVAPALTLTGTGLSHRLLAFPEHAGSDVRESLAEEFSVGLGGCGVGHAVRDLC